MLGTPLGSAEFVAEHVRARILEEQRLWDAILNVPDLQCAWLLLLFCAGPRCNHLLRTLPPSQSATYAAAHDEGMATTAWNLLGLGAGTSEAMTVAQDLLGLPLRCGGVGLRSASRTAPAAYWASWADALPMISARTPGVARRVVDLLGPPGPSAACV